MHKPSSASVFVVGLSVALLSLPGCTTAQDGPMDDDTTMSTDPAMAMFDRGQIHTPATGCLPDYVGCGAVCAHTGDDSRHCGGCDRGCALDAGCSDSHCLTGGGCLGGKVLCSGACRQTTSDANHCGSCGNRCADDALCADSACISGGGDGSRCARPLFWNNKEHERAGFRMGAALSTVHTFPCGPLAPIRTRYFRFTATKTKTDIEIYSDKVDDYIVEVFSGSDCAAASSMGCSDDDRTPDPQLQNVPTVPGQTYFVAVGLKNAPTWSGRSVTLKIDH